MSVFFISDSFHAPLVIKNKVSINGILDILLIDPY